jgi:aminoglycoside N3'-acetyltransferase
MIQGVKQLVPKELRPYLRPTYEQLRRWWANVDRACDRRTISVSQFVQVLEELGISTGATVMVHSSMDEIVRRVPELNAMKLIQLLQQRLGREGTLLMPTFPFLGLQLDYVEMHDTFDPRKTASQVGLATEVFRRMPGVIRSLHPTHSVAGWGKHARDLLATHHLGTTFGPNSPMYKLKQQGGLVAGLGTGLNRLTILHVAEELHPATREWRFEAQPRTMTIIDGPKRIPHAVNVLKSGIDYDFRRIASFLSKDGTLKRVSKGGLKCVAARADRLIERSLELVERHAYYASTWSLERWRRAN